MRNATSRDVAFVSIRWNVSVPRLRYRRGGGGRKRFLSGAFDDLLYKDVTDRDEKQANRAGDRHPEDHARAHRAAGGGATGAADFFTVGG